MSACGCLSAVIRAAFITECLLTSVRGEDADSEEEIEIKYVLIGGGIGLLFAAGFLLMKICIIRKQVHENCTDSSVKRPSEPHVSQSECPMAVVSFDVQS